MNIKWRYITMELVMTNGFSELSVNEMDGVIGEEWSWSWYDFGYSVVTNGVGGQLVDW